MNWEAVSAISTLVATVIVVCTAIFAVMQLNEMKRSRKLDLLWKLFEEFSTAEARESRLFIYNDLPSDPSKATAEHFAKIDEVLSKMDLVWFLIEEKQIEGHFIYDAYGEVFLKLWKILQPFVVYERSRRGNYYRKRAEALVEQIQKYFQQKSLPIEYKAYKIQPRTYGNKANQIRRR